MGVPLIFFRPSGPGGPVNLSASPTSVAPGGTVTATWSGINAPTGLDWVGLFLVGAANTAWTTRRYVNCSTTAGSAVAAGSCAFVVSTAGTYEFRLFSNDSTTNLLATSNAFTASLPGVTTISVSPTAAEAGTSVTVTWNSINSPTSLDWIGLFLIGAANTAWLIRKYVNCGTTPGGAFAAGSCAFVVPSGAAAGSYQFRLFSNDSTTNLLATSNALTVTVPVTVTTTGNYTVVVAWVSTSFTNITADVVHLNISRPLWTLFDSVSPGELQIEVINVSGKYTPDNNSGPFAGLMKNGRQCRVFTSVQSGSSIQLFQGFLDQISLGGNDVNNGRVLLSFRDRAREFRHRVISTSLWVDYNISSLYENVLTASGIIPSEMSIQNMPDEADLGWFRDVPADSALSDMISFNFSKGYVSRGGIVTILGRYYDQELTSVNSYNQFLQLDYSLTDDAVINDARFESDPRRVSSNVSCLSYITQPITIPASSSVAFVMEYIDPVTGRGVPAVNMIQPVPFSDWHAGTSEFFGDSSSGGGPVGPPPGTVDNTTNTTSVSVQFFGETAVNTVFNGTGQTVYLNKYQLRGQHLPEAPKLQAITISSSSQAVYGRRSFFLSSQLLGERDYLSDYGAFLVGRQKDSIPAVRAVIRNQITSASMMLEPGGLVSITNSNTAIGSLHFIKRLEHDIDMSLGVQHTISMELERVSQYTIWTLGHPTLGVLDSGNTVGF